MTAVWGVSCGNLYYLSFLEVTVLLSKRTFFTPFNIGDAVLEFENVAAQAVRFAGRVDAVCIFFSREGTPGGCGLDVEASREGAVAGAG